MCSPVFVRLFVRPLAGLRETLAGDFHEILYDYGLLLREDLTKPWG